MTIDWISSASQKRIPMDRAHPIFYKLGAVAGRKAVVAMSACMATVIACYPSAPALAAQAINLGTVTVTGCGGTLITDSWGNETCVSGFNEGFGGGGGHSGGVIDMGGGGGGGPTDTLVAEAVTRDPQECPDDSQAPAQGAMAMTDHPVLVATGTKVLPELDFLVPPEDFPLKMARVYSKDLIRTGAFGAHWASNIEHTLTFAYGSIQCNGRLDQATSCAPAGNPLSAIYANGEGGFAEQFTNAGSGQWVHNDASIVQSGTEWVLTTPEGGQETYNSYGQPISIRNERGIGLTYSYVGNKLTTITHYLSLRGRCTTGRAHRDFN